MSTEIFDRAMSMDLLKWVLGKTPSSRPVQPFVSRIMSANGTATTPGTEVLDGAYDRLALALGPVNPADYYADFDEAGGTNLPMRNSSTASLYWNYGPVTAVGHELWDSSPTPRRIGMDPYDGGFVANIVDGDVFTLSTSHGIALFGRQWLDREIHLDLGRWLIGEGNPAQPVGPFTMKLVNEDGSMSQPATELDGDLWEPVSFDWSNVTADANGQPTATNADPIVFSGIDSAAEKFIFAYEIWDSSPVPRRIIYRRWGAEGEPSGRFAQVPAGQAVYIAPGDLRITFGEVDI